MKSQNAIVIYHHPQECGSPYVAFISQRTGEVLEEVYIPDGYWDSGSEVETVLEKVYSFQENVNMWPKPTTENVTVKANFLPNPNQYVFRVTGVDNIREDTGIVTSWKADVHIDACRERRQIRYSSGKDRFRQQMEKSGFDMKGWCLYKRRKTPFLDFLKDVCSGYKNYRLVNLIEIG